MKSIVASILLAVFWAPALAKAENAPDTQPSVRPQESATEAAHRYIELLRTKRGMEAVKTYWNFDAMFDAMFGADMKQMNDADRVQMRAIMLEFLGSVFAKPAIAEGLSKSRFSDLTILQLPNGAMGFEFTVTREGGLPIRNSIALSNTTGRWKIYDGSTNGRSMCAALHAAYQDGLAHTPPGQLTPLLFLRQMIPHK